MIKDCCAIGFGISFIVLIILFLIVTNVNSKFELVNKIFIIDAICFFVCLFILFIIN